jgi:mono/diheme cytochrome c family protein
VQGLGHCGACHSPKNLFGAVKDSQRYRGSEIENWFAPNLTSNQVYGLGSWTPDDIVAFLKTGHNARTAAYGAMSEVVEDSTSKMSDADLKAIAVYLKSLAPAPDAASTSRASAEVTDAGKAIYRDSCSACHQLDGRGVPGLFPSLKGSAVAQSEDPLTMLRLILNGGKAASTAANPNATSMPSYAWKLSDKQVAAVASYVREAWGNKGDPVDSSEVADIRAKVETETSAK